MIFTTLNQLSRTGNRQLWRIWWSRKRSRNAYQPSTNKWRLEVKLEPKSAHSQSKCFCKSRSINTSFLSESVYVQVFVILSQHNTQVQAKLISSVAPNPHFNADQKHLRFVYNLFLENCHGADCSSWFAVSCLTLSTFLSTPALS